MHENVRSIVDGNQLSMICNFAVSLDNEISVPGPSAILRSGHPLMFGPNNTSLCGRPARFRARANASMSAAVFRRCDNLPTKST